jgi:hypothetical protein
MDLAMPTPYETAREAFREACSQAGLSRRASDALLGIAGRLARLERDSDPLLIERLAQAADRAGERARLDYVRISTDRKLELALESGATLVVPTREANSR